MSRGERLFLSRGQCGGAPTGAHSAPATTMPTTAAPTTGVVTVLGGASAPHPGAPPAHPLSLAPLPARCAGLVLGGRRSRAGCTPGRAPGRRGQRPPRRPFASTGESVIGRDNDEAPITGGWDPGKATFNPRKTRNNKHMVILTLGTNLFHFECATTRNSGTMGPWVSRTADPA